MKRFLFLSIFLSINTVFLTAQKPVEVQKVDGCNEIVLKRLSTDLVQDTLISAINKNDLDCVGKIFATTHLNPNFRLLYNERITSDPPIWTAVEIGNIEIIKELIKAGLNVKSDEVNTALYIAAETGQLEIIKLLLEAGTDVNGKMLSFTALMIASNRNQQEIIDFLLQSKADVNIASDEGITSLMSAGNVSDIVRKILNAGAKIDFVDKRGWSAVFYAVELTQSEKLKTLLENGADVNLRDKSGQSALSLAEKIADAEKRNEILNLLKKYGAK